MIDEDREHWRKVYKRMSKENLIATILDMRETLMSLDKVANILISESKKDKSKHITLKEANEQLKGKYPDVYGDTESKLNVEELRKLCNRGIVEAEKLKSDSHISVQRPHIIYIFNQILNQFEMANKKDKLDAEEFLKNELAFDKNNSARVDLYFLSEVLNKFVSTQQKL